MSFGFIAKGASRGEPAPALVRGPVASTTVQQLAAGTEWGELDVLVVDMPPGTGDIMLTLCQSVGLSGAVVVTTPGKLAAADTAKGLELLHQARVPVLALVENLAYFEEPSTGVRHRLFGRSYARELATSAQLAHGAAAADGGAAAEATEAGGAFELPIDAAMTEALERAQPLVLAAPDSPSARAFARLAGFVTRAAEEGRAAHNERPNVSYRAADGAVVLRYVSGAQEGREYAVPAARLRASARDAVSASQRAAAIATDGAEPLGRARSAAPSGPKSDAAGASVRPLDISPRGNYGVAIRWSDGHQSAIFPYDQIIELAEDEERRAQGQAGAGRALDSGVARAT